MPANLSIHGKLLICMVGRHRGDELVEITKAAGARGATIALGRTMNDNRLLQALSLADVYQDVVFTILGAETDEVLNALVSAAYESPKKLGGMALLLDVAEIFVRGTARENSAEADMAFSRSKEMQSGYDLITVIVNYGFADDVMAIARKAGARGGTVLNARGTGTEDDVKFFGISLVPEKEMLFIVAEKAKVQEILDAVNSIPNLCKPGGGIVFNMELDEFIVLGKEQERLMRPQD